MAWRDSWATTPGWQVYIDTSLVSSGHIDKAAIWDPSSHRPVASSPAYAPKASGEITEKECLAAEALLSGDEGAKSNAETNGLFVGGEKYFFRLTEEGVIYGRKGRDGVVIAKSKSVIFFAHHNENQQAGNATQMVQYIIGYIDGTK